MSLREKSSARCVVCGSDEDVEQNHIGGRNHIAWFTMPFCRKHHDQFHALLRNAGVELEYTPDPQERMLRALGATWIANWIFTEALRELNSASNLCEKAS